MVTNQFFEIKGLLSNSEVEKTIHVEQDSTIRNFADAIDYAAMFHSIDEIVHVKLGELVAGVFFENHAACTFK